MRHDVGAFIFEIARSEIGYTEQRPANTPRAFSPPRSARNIEGPVFIQGDHFQASAKKWATPDGKATEIEGAASR